MPAYKVLTAGDTGLVIEFSDGVDRQLSSWVLALARRLNEVRLEGIAETVSAPSWLLRPDRASEHRAGRADRGADGAQRGVGVGATSHADDARRNIGQYRQVEFAARHLTDEQAADELVIVGRYQLANALDGQ